jgi:hypothetical protein
MNLEKTVMCCFDHFLAARKKINQLYSFSVNYFNVDNSKQHPEISLPNFGNSSVEIRGNALQYTSTDFNEFNVHGSVHRNNILIYIQQDAALHSLFYLETALHVSGGTITHHQERKQLYLQHLVFVTLLLLSAAIVEELEMV